MKKIIIFSLCCIIGTVSILCLTAYQVLHKYTGKVNYVPIDREHVYEGNPEVSSGAYGPMNDTEAFASGSLKGQRTEGQTSNSSDGAALTPTPESGNAEVTSGEQQPTGGSQEVNDDGGTELQILEDRIARNIEDNDETVMKDRDVLNILLIGTDNRSTQDRGLSDSIILLSVNKEEETIVATSLLRDIYLSIPGYRNNRLNAAYAIGGAGLLIKTIENNFKIEVDKYASIDFFSFIEVVDAIGGIELEVTEEELPYVNDYIREINGILKEDNTDLLTKAGLQQLTGKQALGYARVRYVGTDFARTSRQRKIVELILDKVRKMSMSDINDLLDIILPEVTTDFKEKEIFYQLLALPDYLDYDFDSWSIPMKGTYQDMTVRGMQVLGIDFSDNIKELMNRIYLTRR